MGESNWFISVCCRYCGESREVEQIGDLPEGWFERDGDMWCCESHYLSSLKPSEPCNCGGKGFRKLHEGVCSCRKLT